MIRVIVADDEYKVCQLICQLIHWDALGMQLVGTASNGIEALQMIEAEKPDLVLTDIRMPGYDGMELLKRARLANPAMEFIIISGYSQFEYAQTAIRYGVSDYILKPVNEEALNATLQKVRQRYLEHQAQAEENREQKKQQVMDQARLRDTLWMDLELGQTSAVLEILNEKYRYHFEKGMFRVFLIQADIKDNKNLSEHYAENVMELLNSKLPGLFKKRVEPLCTDSEVFCRGRKAAGILNYKEEETAAVRNALEVLIGDLSKELHAFEYIRFHLAVSSAVSDTEKLSGCVTEAELAMGQRLCVRNSLFLEEIPENAKFNSDDLYKPFSVMVRQSLDLQDTEQIRRGVEQIHEGALAFHLNGVQMLRLVKDAYRLFLMSGVFQSEYHFEDRETREESFYRKAELCSSHENLFAYLAEVCRKNMEDACAWFNIEKMRPINQAKRYIKKHFSEGISLEEVSSEVGFSSSYFSTLFRKETGKTFLEYLMDVRIEEAKVLLRESKMTIEMVVKSVGVNDYKRFSKTFKKNTGISPKEYRNLYS